jgi:hypothetical protein
MPSGTAVGAVVSADEGKASQRQAPLPALPGISSTDRNAPDARSPRAPSLTGQAAKAAQASADVNGKLAKLPPGTAARPAGAPVDLSVGIQDCGTVAKDRAKLAAAGIKSVLCTEVSKAPPLFKLVHCYGAGLGISGSSERTPRSGQP